MSGTRFALVPGSLALEIEPSLLPLVESSWLPRGTARTGEHLPASIRVSSIEAGVPSVPAEPTLILGSVAVTLPGDDTACLSGREGCTGWIDLSRRAGVIGVPDSGTPGIGFDVYSMLTATSALLLGRLGKALMHAAAVVSPDGSAWLLAGDARSGKSTTCVNLIKTGWNYLSDDQVVLELASGHVAVTGLPRCFHLDEGWGTGSPRNARRGFDPDALGTGRRAARAALGTLLFPRVEACAPTGLEPISAGAALGGLVRQSPWLLADAPAAPAVLQLLQRAARLPAYSLRLGMDTFEDGAALAASLLAA